MKTIRLLLMAATLTSALVHADSAPSGKKTTTDVQIVCSSSDVRTKADDRVVFVASNVYDGAPINDTYGATTGSYTFAIGGDIEAEFQQAVVTLETDRVHNKINLEVATPHSEFKISYQSPRPIAPDKVDQVTITNESQKLVQVSRALLKGSFETVLDASRAQDSDGGQAGKNYKVLCHFSRKVDTQ